MWKLSEKGCIRVFLQAKVGERLQKFLALQKRHGVELSGLKQVKEGVPVRAGAVHQRLQLLCFVLGEAHLPFPGSLEAQGIIQKNLVDRTDIGQHFIHKFAPVTRLGTNDPQHKFMLGKALDVIVHPGGDTAVDIRVGAFQHKTNFHAITCSIRW